MTRAAPVCRRRSAGRSRSTPWSTISARCRALGITGKVALAGIAVGGAIALHAAVRLAPRISAIVAGSPATGVAPDRRPAILARVERIEREGMRFAVEGSMASGYAPELRWDAARFAAFRARWLGNDPASYAAIYRMLLAMDLQPELARIACPTLVLGGSLDKVRPPALAEPVAQAIPGARYQVLETGHYMAVATPEPSHPQSARSSTPSDPESQVSFGGPASQDRRWPKRK